MFSLCAVFFGIGRILSAADAVGNVYRYTRSIDWGREGIDGTVLAGNTTLGTLTVWLTMLPGVVDGLFGVTGGITGGGGGGGGGGGIVSVKTPLAKLNRYPAALLSVPAAI